MRPNPDTSKVGPTFSSKNKKIERYSSNNCLKVALVNARSIRNKVIELTDSLQSKDIDLSAVTETWLFPEDSVIIGQYNEFGFNVTHLPRTSRKGGGGVGVLTKTHLKINKANSQAYNSFELLETKLQCKKEKFIFSTIYRTGSLNIANRELFFKEIEQYVLSKAVSQEHIIIWGDFNFHVENPSDTVAQDFLDLMHSMGFNQLINFPTHNAGGTLDLIFLRDETVVKNIKVYNEENDVLISDHFLIEMSLICAPNYKKEKIQYSYRKVKSINMENFSNDLSTKLSTVASMPLNQKTCSLNYAICTVLDQHAPKQRKVATSSSKPFYHIDIAKAKRKKRQAERKYRKTGSIADKCNLNAASRNLSIVAREKHNEFYSKRLSDLRGDAKGTYKVINHLLNKSNKRYLPEYKNSEDLAKKFEDFFCKKIENICMAMNSTFVEPVPNSTTTIFETFEIVSGDELQNILNATKMKYSTVDDIPTDVLPSVINSSFPVILDIVNESLQSGIFPNFLKRTHVIPVAKSKNQDCNLLSNFRPICNTSIYSKPIESCALKQLQDHLKNNNLIITNQSAYKKNHSCETALLKIQNDILTDLDPATNIIVVLLDFSAAFDTVCHKRLLCKLKDQYGIRGIALNWFKSYLSERKFQVKIDDYISDGKLMEFGVPQGTVLAPKLFELYTQEISTIIDKYGLKYHIFADDIQIYMPLTCNAEMITLNECLAEIKTWADQNFLKLNEAKTNFIEIYTRPANMILNDFTLLSKRFKCNPYGKSLGIVIDNKFSFKKQITEVCNKGFGMLRNLWKLSSKVISIALKTQLVHCCILSKMDFCNSLYFNLPAKEITKLQRLINASMRYVFNLKIRKTRITPFLKKAHILPAQHRIRFKICVLIFKCIHNDGPEYLSSLISEKNSLQSLRVYNDTTLLNEPSLNKQSYKNRRFEISAPREWNKLPQTLREETVLSTFKKRLKTFMFDEF